ncbi:AraC family transcriptional regulator [Herbiconiux liangxiaofengii]|uniref:AraC family transcriptional regulator n=1 Tax=Herbiconiux liangxiaofengii TaxID=3342795 RepID=UPI0035B902BF
MDDGAARIARTERSGDDLDDAREMYERGYNGADFQAERSESDFAFRYTMVGGENMTLRSSTYLGTITGRIQPENEYIVSWLIHGSGVMEADGESKVLEPGRPAMFPAGKPFDFDFADYRQNLIHLRAGYLEQVAAEHEGALPGPITFDHTASPEGAALTRWVLAVEEAARLLISGSPTLLQLAEVDRRIAVTLLETFPHVTSRLPDSLLVPRNGRLRQAVEYMHANVAAPLSPSDIAAEVGLTPRGLQQAFQRQLGATPTEYLRGLRLERVRAELVHLSPRDATVAEVAARWGFTHAGRFSAAYAARFREYPSATLQR